MCSSVTNLNSIINSEAAEEIMDRNEGKLSNEEMYPKENLKVSASRKEDEQEKEFEPETSEEEFSAELDDVLEKKEIGDDIESATTNEDTASEKLIGSEIAEDASADCKNNEKMKST